MANRQALRSIAQAAGLTLVAGVSVVAAASLGWAGERAPLREPTVEELHGKLFADTDYPSASQCASCHQGIYDEWSSSSHAYASISPVFHKFEQRINDLSQGTIGYFCMRCHAGIGTTLKEGRDASLMARSQVG